MACSSDEGGEPVVLRVDVRGLPTEPFSSAVWGEGACDWESETACLVDVPIGRIAVFEAGGRTEKDDGTAETPASD